MAEQPLLVFPEPARAERAKRHGGGGKVRLPNARQQAGRLAPQLQRLQQAMDRQRVTLQGNPVGLQPEQVLVLETIGPIQNFMKAVKKVEGLEWLGEFEIDDIAPEYGFADEKDDTKQLTGQLFLVMTDQLALRELQRLFTRWRQHPDSKFPLGLAPLKHAFAHLRTIRPWDSEDRIRDTGLLEDWKDRIARGQEVVPFEVELWFRQDLARQQQADTYLGDVIVSLGGEVTQSVYKKVTSCMAQASRHEVDHSEIDHCFARVSQSFIVFAETPIPSQPSEGAFDDPAVRNYFEASHVVASPDNLQ